MAFGGSLPQINLGVQDVTQGGHHSLPGAIFQQDNARPHTARVAHHFLRHFQTLPWPARSPDLSPAKTADVIVSLCT
ncbi:hypothetical protein TNCV_3727741 [Trichonephila clavipes]|uniref:Uncharacterized protein n=1 Tax=Trichonephila clavipes TaxID=2585209 RepID=A0A8X6R9W8_TRICX|nr:hypothetical protein TNCV_3727741 [Trichonephila clavipes]